VPRRADVDRGGALESATDPVTGALARGGLPACLGSALVDAARSGGYCSVFLFDVDHFKSINDTYGHPRGDQVLRQIAERVAELVRPTDVLVRYGGDEFVLVLPRTTRPEAMAVATTLVDGLKSEPLPGNPPLSVSVSVGSATFPDDAANADELLAVADRRNYLAKDRGRSRAVADDLVVAQSSELGRVLERDAALAAAHDFLVRLIADGRGAACVSGPPGVGHSRFLAEVSTLAELRGFVVVSAESALADEPPTAAGPDTVPARVLIVADTEVDWARVIRLIRASAGADVTPAALGMVYAVHDPAVHIPPPLPVIATIPLSPLSAEAVRIWLRTSLRGEPGPDLVDWVTRCSRGLPARAKQELARLIATGGVDIDDGRCDLSAVAATRRAHARRRLPVALSTLIGRRQETSAVVAMVSRTGSGGAAGRLVTLVGAGGIGKTRLSLAVADAVADEFEQGTVFVNLAEATTPGLVVAALAEALDISEVPGEPLSDTVVKQLADRSLLLVLDNLEQVLSAVPFVADLLSAALGVTVLATSRERLGLPDERVYAVPPLPLPDLDQLAGHDEDLAAAMSSSPALTLFVTRAREAVYDLVFTPTEVRAAALACHRLDGLPLAIELAAAHCDTLTPTQLLERLSGWTSRLDLLTDGPQDLPPRQQTLRSTLDWSFALIDPEDQDLVTRLVVFAGGATVDAVSAVCLPDEGTDVAARRLARLTDKSLLTRSTTPDAERYSMLETIRSYVGERFAGSPGEAGTRKRHAEYFAWFAEQVKPDLSGPAGIEAHARLARDYANLRAAMDWALAHGEQVTAGRIVLSLEPHWAAGWHGGDGWQWYHRILAEPDRLPDRMRIELLQAAAFLAVRRADHLMARQWSEEGLLRARELADPRLVAGALHKVGTAAMMAGDYPSAREYLRECLSLQSEHDKPSQASTYVNLTTIALRMGDLDAAEQTGRRGLELARQVGRQLICCVALTNLAEIAIERGDTRRARTLLAEALEIGRQIGDMSFEAYATHRLGLAEQHDGNLVESYRHIAAALRIHHEGGRRSGVMAALTDLSNLLARADPVRAARLGAAAEAYQERHALPMGPFDIERHDRAYALLRATLTEAELAEARTAGQTAPFDDIVAEALAVDPNLCA
jgi:diguanylate cyclase (GGDEF)-like protein